jgi:hypothetical protein
MSTLWHQVEVSTNFKSPGHVDSSEIVDLPTITGRSASRRPRAARRLTAELLTFQKPFPATLARAIERKPTGSLSRVRRRFLNVTADALGAAKPQGFAVLAN